MIFWVFWYYNLWFFKSIFWQNLYGITIAPYHNEWNLTYNLFHFRHNDGGRNYCADTAIGISPLQQIWNLKFEILLPEPICDAWSTLSKPIIVRDTDIVHTLYLYNKKYINAHVLFKKRLYVVYWKLNFYAISNHSLFFVKCKNIRSRKKYAKKRRDLEIRLQVTSPHSKNCLSRDDYGQYVTTRFC